MELISTPNPNAKKIELVHDLTVGTVINSSDNTSNELCSKILDISGIISIFAGPGFLTVTKDEEHSWDLINTDIITQFDTL